MQKSFIAIALALTLTCAFAVYNPIAAGYVKAPQSVAGDNESNFTNSASLQLISANSGELDLLGANFSAGANITTTSWVAAYRKLDGKALTASTNSSVSFTAGSVAVVYVNGYAVSWTVENDTNSIPQISIYQTPLSGGAALSKLVVSSNNNTGWSPLPVGTAVISKTVYVFYLTVNTSSTAFQVNVTNFAVGGTTKGSGEFTLTTAFTGSFAVAWGEALGSNQLFANWLEGSTFKDATIDVSKGAVTANAVTGWNANYTCTAFSTDKKWFGDLCFDAKTTPGNIIYYVRSSNTTLTQLTSSFTNTSLWTGVYPYGPYIAITYTGTVISNGTTTVTYGYDIWNLDSFTAYRNRTNFLTTDGTAYSQIFRVTSGGLYQLLANTNSAIVNSTVVTNHTSIQVGLILGSSYLTSVLGFILTIVAGLLLF